MTYFIYGLGLLFIGLKLGSVIDWSWWFVLMPLYMMFIVWCILAFMGAYTEAKERAAREKYEKEYPWKQSKFMKRLDEVMKAKLDEARQNKNR